VKPHPEENYYDVAIDPWQMLPDGLDGPYWLGFALGRLMRSEDTTEIKRDGPFISTIPMRVITKARTAAVFALAWLSPIALAVTRSLKK